VLKLFCYLYPSSTLASELGCRRCHNLTYLSVNCGGNPFYERVVKPYRRWQCLRGRLQSPFLSRSERADLETNVASLEHYLREATKRYAGNGSAERQAPRRAQLSAKRAYKSLKWA
jgi:hypothetical protein